MINDPDSQEDEQRDDDLTEEEAQARKDAASSAAFKKVIELHNKENQKLSRSDRIRKLWTFVDISGELEGFSGTLCTTTIHKFPKKGRGKVMFWSPFMAILNGDKVVVMHKMEYVNGIRPKDSDVFNMLMRRIKASNMDD